VAAGCTLCAAAVPAERLLTGQLESNGSPRAGERVALYSQTQGLLVDHTFSREDGSFTLRPPPYEGRLFLVVTSAAQSQRQDVHWTAQGTQRVTIPPPPSASLPQRLAALVWRRGETLFGMIFGAVFGFLGGIVTQKFQDRRLLRLQGRRLLPRRQRIVQARDRITGLVESEKATPRDKREALAALRDEYGEVRKVLGREAGQLRKGVPEEMLVVTVWGERGLEARESLQQTTDAIERFSNDTSFPPTELAPLDAAIQKLKGNPLLNM